MTTSDVSSDVLSDATADEQPAASSHHADPDGSCPCGSGKTYGECCGPYHAGTAWPDDPVTMMRSRYSAYATHTWDYLEKSDWQEQGEEEITAEMLEEKARDLTWVGLDIVGSGRDEEADCDYVDYLAAYAVDGVTRQIAEHAYFKTIDGKLYYTGGEELVREPVRREHPKIGRNDPCPCGSGKKYKKCCGRNA